MKKSGKFIFMILIFFFTINATALTKSELETYNLKKIKSYNFYSGYRYVQGGTATDKYVILAEGYSDNGKTILKVIDKNNFEAVKTVKDYSFGHANDITYNAKTNKVIVTYGAASNKMYILNADTLKLEKTIETKRGYSSIAYDEIKDNYIARRGQTAYVLDLNFNEKSKFTISSENLTTQGFEAYNGKLYYTLYEAGKVTRYQTIYGGILKANENIVTVYDIDTRKKEKTYYIPLLTKSNIYPGEVEGISFIGNKPIIWTNYGGMMHIFSPVVTSKKSKIELDMEDFDTADNNILLGLYSGDELLGKTYNKNNKFVFSNLSSNDEKNIVYTLKVESNDYKLNTNKLKVSYEYDPFYNAIVPKYENNISVSKISQNNKKQNNVKKDEENTKEVVDSSGVVIDQKDNSQNDTSEQNSIKDESNSEDKSQSTESENVEEKDTQSVHEEIEENTSIDNNTVSMDDLIPESDEESSIVDVPDTGTKASVSIIGVMLILISALFIKHRKIG